MTFITQSLAAVSSLLTGYFRRHESSLTDCPAPQNLPEEFRHVSTVAGCSMIQSLPEEIKLNICSQLVIDGPEEEECLYSLAALRLTCKAFAYLLTEIIYEAVKLYPSIESLRALESVALHPSYSFYVQTLGISALYLPVFGSFDGWLEKTEKSLFKSDQEVIIRRTWKTWFRGQQIPDALRQDYNHYVNRVRDQTLFQEMSLSNLSKRLATHLSKMPNLTNIYVCTLAEDSSTGCQGNHPNMLRRKGLLLREDSHDGYLQEHVRLLHALFNASSLSTISISFLAMDGLNIMSFSVEAFALEFAKEWGWSTEDEDWSGPVRCEIFNTVDRLELIDVFLTGEDRQRDADDWDEFEEENLANFILAFGSLTELALHFTPQRCGPCLIETLGSGVEFCNLTVLDLGNVQTYQDDFMQFLTAHKKSLRSLSIESIVLHEDCWVPIFHVLVEDFMLQAIQFDALYELKSGHVWCRNGPDFPDSLWTRFAPSIIETNMECPLRILDNSEASLRAWTELSDSSLSYEKY